MPSSERRWKLINPGDLAKRIIFGIIGSCLVSTVLLFMQIRRYVLISMAAILSFFGYKIDPPQELKDAVTQTIARVDDAVEKKLKKIDETVDRKVTDAAKKMPNIGVKSSEQLKFEAEQKEAERRRQEESERRELTARLEATGESAGESWSLEKLRLYVEQAEAWAKQKAEQRPWIERATRINLTLGSGLSAQEMRKLVLSAEDYLARDADYQAERRSWRRQMEHYNDMLANGPNGVCPNCRLPQRVHGDYSPFGTLCPGCNAIYPNNVMKYQWRNPPPPKEPQPPRMNTSLIGKLLRN